MRKLGIRCFGFNNLTDEEYIKLVSEVGFNCVSTNVEKSDVEQLKWAKLLKKYNLEYENMHAPFDHINDMWLTGENGDKMLKELKDSVCRCNLVGVSTMIVHLSSGFNAPFVNDLGISRFIELVNFAKEKNVKIAFENLRKISNLAWAMEYFENYENVGFCWDVGHEACFSPNKHFMPFYGERLIALHIHDNNCMLGCDEHFIPFDGKIDFNYVCNEIRKSKYQGPITLEVLYGESYKNVSPKDYFLKAYNVAKKIRNMVENV